MPGVAPIAGWLKVSKVDNGDEVLADVQLYGQELGGRGRGLADRARARGAQDRSLLPRLAPSARVSHSSAQLCARARAGGRSGGRAHLRGTLRRWRSTPKACASASPRRPRACVPAISSLAGNVHLGALMPRVVGTLVPIWSYVITTAPLGPRLAEAIAYRGAVTRYRSGQQPLPHRRQRPADVVGTARPHGRQSRPGYVPRLHSGHRGRSIRSSARSRSEHAWSGALGNPLHRMPQIGELVARRLAGERLRRPWSQHHRHGRQHHRAGDRRGRSRPGGCSRRSSWSGRAGRWAAPRCRSTTGGSMRAKRFAARQARQRDARKPARVGARGFARGEEAGARLRRGWRAAGGRASALPQEPALAELPADPIAAGEIAGHRAADGGAGRRRSVPYAVAAMEPVAICRGRGDRRPQLA